MNSKGQTLVLFVLILPLLFIILIMLINYATISLEKQKIDNNVKQTIEYGLNLKLDEKVVEDGVLTNSEIENKLSYLLSKNITYDDLNIDVSDNRIFIMVSKSINGFLSSIFNGRINISYNGEIIDDKFVIERR